VDRLLLPRARRPDFDFDAEAPFNPSEDDELAAAEMFRPTDDELGMIASTGTI
jgi:hypothetical protein